MAVPGQGKTAKAVAYNRWSGNSPAPSRRRWIGSSGDAVLCHPLSRDLLNAARRFIFFCFGFPSAVQSG